MGICEGTDLKPRPDGADSRTRNGFCYLIGFLFVFFVVSLQMLLQTHCYRIFTPSSATFSHHPEHRFRRSRRTQPTGFRRVRRKTLTHDHPKRGLGQDVSQLHASLTPDPEPI